MNNTSLNRFSDEMGERAVIYFAHDKAPVQLKHCFWWRKKKDKLEKKVRKGEKRVSKCKLHSRTPFAILFNGYFPGVQKSGGGPKVTSHCQAQAHHAPHAQHHQPSKVSVSGDWEEGNSCMVIPFTFEHETNLLPIS